MQQLLHICNEYAAEHQLIYNGSKSFSLCFKRNGLKISSPTFILDQSKIPLVEQCTSRYLETTCKYITIKTNTEEARKQLHDDFLSKQVFHQLDSNIHVADPNQNDGILEKALKETHLVYRTVT